MKNTATYFVGKLYSGRFRHPRHIKKGEPLSMYSEEYAEVQEILRILGNSIDRNINFFKDFIIEYEDYCKRPSTLIITETSLYICYGVEKCLIYFELKQLKDCTIHIADKPNRIYLIVFRMQNGDSLFSPTKDLQLCQQVFFLLRKGKKQIKLPN
jgi:hypothetical protein